MHFCNNGENWIVPDWFMAARKTANTTFLVGVATYIQCERDYYISQGNNCNEKYKRKNISSSKIKPKLAFKKIISNFFHFMFHDHSQTTFYWHLLKSDWHLPRGAAEAQHRKNSSADSRNSISAGDLSERLVESSYLKIKALHESITSFSSAAKENIMNARHQAGFRFNALHTA